jgi:PTS system galactitol-specific IIB component
MKKVYLVCGTGIATSAVLRVKIEEYLDEHNMQATVQQLRVAELNPGFVDADVIVSTTAIPPEIQEKAPVVDGIPLITGIGEQEALQKVLEILKAKS